jgi:hypothetical protein
MKWFSCKRNDNSYPLIHALIYCRSGFGIVCKRLLVAGAKPGMANRAGEKPDHNCSEAVTKVIATDVEELKNEKGGLVLKKVTPQK